MPSRRATALAVALNAIALCIAVPARADSVHVVTPGDSLYRIALRYGATVGAITRANGLRSPDRVYVGQRLLIPSHSGGASPSPRAAPGGAGATGIHIVAAGESLSTIAARYRTTVAALVRANGLPSADLVYTGQRLVIPGAGGASPGGGGPPPPSGGGPGRRILVDLSSQSVTAFEGNTAVATFRVSTGKASTPTPIGTYRIYARYRSQTMSGPGYYLPGVPYVQYFVGGYALHGTYWHTSFGTPMSHGCVNLSEPNAGWLWNWAAIGTPVTVQW